MNYNLIEEPFVLTIVHGRLGNILFQLSAGLKYAKDNHLNFYWAPLCADSRRDYKKYISSNDLLNTVYRNLVDSYIDEEFFISRPNETNKYNQEIFKNIYIHGFSGDAFDFKKIPLSKNLVLFGQFYNSKYLDINLCKKIFEISVDISNEIKSLYGDLSNFTSIHVRRGDFINGDGLCLDKSFYINCISKFDLNSNFLVISDDIGWCKQNFINGNYNFVFAEKKTKLSDSIFDFYLLTKCKNNICSKSTFSWWGAYLNTSSNKIVIYPTSIGDILHRRVPRGWIKVYIPRIQLIYKLKRILKLINN